MTKNNSLDQIVVNLIQYSTHKFLILKPIKFKQYIDTYNFFVYAFEVVVLSKFFKITTNCKLFCNRNLKIYFVLHLNFENWIQDYHISR